MKTRCRLFFTLVIVLLLASLGSAQAAFSGPFDLADTSGPASAYPAELWEKSLVHSSDSAGSHVAIAFDPDGGQAAWVSYHHETDGGLWVAHQVAPSTGNCGPSNDWRCEQVDQVNTQLKGLYTSIDIHPDTNPNPMLSTWKVGVSYYDDTQKSLKYAQYRCPPIEGCYWTLSTVHAPPETGDDFGLYTSLAFDSSGIPHIAYFEIYHQGIYSLAYAYFVGGAAGNCGDGSDWSCADIDWGNTPEGLYPSLDVGWNDEIYISYYNSNLQRLHLASTVGYSNCGPVDTFHCEILDDPVGADVGYFSSLVAPRDATDIVRIAYYDKTNGNLKYAYPRGDTDGNCGQGDSWQCDVVDQMGADLSWASISMVVDSAGFPVVAYSDVSGAPPSFSLNVAELAQGQPYANCGAGAWYCGQVDSGNMLVDKGRYAALAIRPGGALMIAYSSFGKLPSPDINLRVAYQPLRIFLPLAIQ